MSSRTERGRIGASQSAGALGKALMNSLLVLACLLAGLLATPTAAAQSMSGTLNWSDWSLTWAIENSAGISIKTVKYNNRLYLHKGSMPTIRVQYNNNSCGPYADRLKWDTIHTNPNTNEKARIEYGDGFVKIWVYAEISAYRLRQGWILYLNGTLVPFMESSGLQCVVTHRHHPYWRFDFDITGSADDVVTTTTAGVWSDWTLETQQKKAADRWWIVSDFTTGRSLQFWPRSTEGSADTFATYDFGVRRYNGLEHEPWLPDNASYDDQGDLSLSSANAEGVYRQDIVVWYVGHLAHNAAAGPNQWGYSGPSMRFY